MGRGPAARYRPAQEILRQARPGRPPNSTTPCRSSSADYIEVEHLLAGTACTLRRPRHGPARVTSSGHRYVTRVLARYPRQQRHASAAGSSSSRSTPPTASTGTPCGCTPAACCRPRGTRGSGSVCARRRRSNSNATRPAAVRDVDISSNELAWGMLQAIGTLIKLGGEHSPLDDLPVRHVYLGGYSQSGVDTATFAAAFGARYPHDRRADGIRRLFSRLSCGEHDPDRRRRGRTAAFRIRRDAGGRGSRHRDPTTKRCRRIQLRTVRQPRQRVDSARRQ